VSAGRDSCRGGRGGGLVVEVTVYTCTVVRTCGCSSAGWGGRGQLALVRGYCVRMYSLLCDTEPIFMEHGTSFVVPTVESVS